MKNPSFKTMSAAVTVGLTVSAVIIALMCVIPKRLVNRMYDESMPYVENALEKAISNRNSEAIPDIEKLIEIIDEHRDTLLLFYDHKDVAELTWSAETAYDLSKTDDTAQLITELCDITKVYRYLKHINDMSIFNIF
ncbi:MAG: DUF4363 family protein [Clostridiales bacterium]|nr:DUF4363 family protein [Clostridiales bacterium]